ncbi:hypothetical protein Tco_1322918 [Tanacetum coccineum]
MFDEYFEQSRVNEQVPSATAVNAQVVPPGTSLSTTFAQDASSTSVSPSSSYMQPPARHQGVANGPIVEDTPITQHALHPLFNPVTREPSFAQSSSEDVSLAEPNQVTQPPDHLRKWSKDHPLDNIVGNPSRPNEEQDSDSDDNDNAHVPKVQSTTSWFSPIPEEDRPATPEPEWTIPSNDYPEPENNWANVYATTYQDPEENKLQRKTGDIGSFIKWFCKRTGKKKLCKADLEGPTFNLVDLVNPEGHQILRNVYEPLPLGGPPGQLDFGLEELVPSLWVESERNYDISVAYDITHWWVRRKEFYINKHREPSDRDRVKSHMRILSVICIKTYKRYTPQSTCGSETLSSGNVWKTCS